MSFHASKVIHNFLNLLSILEKVCIGVMILIGIPGVSIVLPSTSPLLLKFPAESPCAWAQEWD